MTSISNLKNKIIQELKNTKEREKVIREYRKRHPKPLDPFCKALRKRPLSPEWKVWEAEWKNDCKKVNELIKPYPLPRYIRHIYIVYGFLKGKEYEQIEPMTHLGNEPNLELLNFFIEEGFGSIEKFKDAHGGFGSYQSILEYYVNNIQGCSKNHLNYHFSYMNEVYRQTTAVEGISENELKCKLERAKTTIFNRVSKYRDNNISMVNSIEEKIHAWHWPYLINVPLKEKLRKINEHTHSLVTTSLGRDFCFQIAKRDWNNHSALRELVRKRKTAAILSPIRYIQHLGQFAMEEKQKEMAQ